jgi:hypothetical protein
MTRTFARPRDAFGRRPRRIRTIRAGSNNGRVWLFGDQPRTRVDRGAGLVPWQNSSRFVRSAPRDLPVEGQNGVASRVFSKAQIRLLIRLIGPFFDRICDLCAAQMPQSQLCQEVEAVTRVATGSRVSRFIRAQKSDSRDYFVRRVSFDVAVMRGAIYTTFSPKALPPCPWLAPDHTPWDTAMNLAHAHALGSPRPPSAFPPPRVFD